MPSRSPAVAISRCRKRPGRFIKWLWLSSSLLLTSPSNAAEREWWTAGGIGVGSLATLSAVWFAMPQPATCSWCAPSNFDQSITSALLWTNRSAASAVSDVVVYGLLPILTLGSLVYISPRLDRFGLYALTVFDAVVVNFLATEILKRSVARARPDLIPADEAYLSFPSGHTSAAFALVASTSVIAFKERSPWAPYILSGGVVFAGVAGYLRIAADKHWTSDVLVGMAIGTAVGIATPFAILGNWRVSPLVNGTGLNLEYSLQ